MVGPTSGERLRRALAELHAAGWDGARPSMAKVCARAGLGRATAYRCEGFVDDYRRVLSSANARPKDRRDEARPSKADTMSALRASINGLANMVQHLSLVNQQQSLEIERLRAAPPTAHGDGKVVSLRGPAKARRAASRL